MEDFKKLPTKQVNLTLDYKVIPHIANVIEKEKKSYFQAIVHYRTNENGEREYLLEPDKIKELLLMTPQTDGYSHAILKRWRYGVKLPLVSKIEQ